VCLIGYSRHDYTDVAQARARSRGPASVRPLACGTVTIPTFCIESQIVSDSAMNHTQTDKQLQSLLDGI
jgi:hypothetical protein